MNELSYCNLSFQYNNELYLKGHQMTSPVVFKSQGVWFVKESQGELSYAVGI